MTDVTASTGTADVTKATVKTSPALAWPDVVNTALHYLAGAALIGLVGYFVSINKLSSDLLVALVTGAAAGIGILSQKS
jgi:hypothetical protein